LRRALIFEEGSQPRFLRKYIGRRGKGGGVERIPSGWRFWNGSLSIIGICFPRIDMSFAVLIMLISLFVEMATHCVGERVPFFGGGLFG
jgi:hypothetical protein